MSLRDSGHNWASAVFVRAVNVVPSSDKISYELVEAEVCGNV
jgi:hypothetical protein